eukprot:SAG11_NODE_19284_length_470_cov_0.830189_1_plen_72_part_10
MLPVVLVRLAELRAETAAAVTVLLIAAAWPAADAGVGGLDHGRPRKQSSPAEIDGRGSERLRGLGWKNHVGK